MPSLREKKRYVRFKVYSDKDMDKKTVFKAINNNYIKFFGVSGLSKAGLQLVKYGDDQGIMRVGTKSLDEFRLVLSTLQSIGTQKVMMSAIKISGIMSGVK